MTLAYFDTSVLVKNYIQEVGSSHARTLLRRHTFLSSSITPVELMSALMRRRSRGELGAQDVSRIFARVHVDRLYWKLLEVAPSVLNQGEELIQKTQMRTLDAIHIASVASVQAATGIRIPFITGDSRQHDAAAHLDLDVVWIG